MSGPAVSVLLATYNYERYLDGAIASVLAQTRGDLELIVVDDGSSDGTPAVLERWRRRDPVRMRVIRHEVNRGLQTALETALAAARAPVIAYIEADDVWEARNLEIKMRVLDEHPEVGVVYARYRPFGRPGGVVYWTLYEWANALSVPSGRALSLWPQLLQRNPVASFTHFIVRRRWLERVPRLGCHRSNLDWWVLAHVSAETLFWRVPGRLTRWRIHEHSAAYGPMTLRRILKLKVFLDRLCASFERGAGSDRIERERLRAARALQRIADARDSAALALYAAVRPVATLRFAAHVVLRNLLLRRRAA
ncbi:MAG: hypothetical protein MOGMAGMI_01537 [Candidatus Omnitrophica bacterium]|nr:hypothetical protein [Candidatus Omnitrophota bacterium]